MPAHKSPLAALVDDDNSHFPYKLDDALAAVTADAPAGPGGPDDDRVRTGDFLNAEIAEASAAYVAAQSAYFTGGTVEAFGAMQEAANALVRARQAHREGRGEGMTVTAVRAPRAGR